MKKTIILTFMLLLLALVSDVLMTTNANGMNTLKADILPIPYPKHNMKKDEAVDSTKLFTKLVLNENKLVEKIETQVLYKGVKGTVYHAVKSQTDDTPFLTADMSFIDTSKVNDLRWVALSRDLLKRRFTDLKGKKHIWNGKIKLGDTIWIDYDKSDLWKVTHHNQNPNDTKAVKRNDAKYERMKAKYEQIKGYWIVHDVMGTKYTRRTRSGKLILDENGNKQVVHIHNAIDFLQHPELGMSDVWDRNIIISKKKITYITSNAVALASK